MGHAEIRTTLNIYAKAVPGWQEQAAAKLDATWTVGQSWDSRGPKPSGRERFPSG
jgi:hypothetical protein